MVLTVQTRQLLQSSRKEQLQKFDPLPAGAQTPEHGFIQSLFKESYGIIITSQSDQRVVQFDGRREVFEAIDFEIIVNHRHCLKMRVQARIDTAPGVVAQAAPHYAAHERV